jgi:hypothetical protein
MIQDRTESLRSGPCSGSADSCENARLEGFETLALDIVAAMKVSLQVHIPDGGPEETAELTIWLKDQIGQLPIESIEIPKIGTRPEGARPGDPFTWGAIIVAVAPTVVEQLLKLLRDRIKRQKTPVKIQVECDGKKVTIEGNPDPKQLEAVGTFLKEIEAKSG